MDEMELELSRLTIERDQDGEKLLFVLLSFLAVMEDEMMDVWNPSRFPRAITPAAAERAINRLEKVVNRWYSLAGKQMTVGLAVPLTDTLRGAGTAFTKVYGLKLPPPAPMKVADVWVRGAPILNWWDAQRDSLVRKAAATLRLGLQANKSLDDILRELVGVATGRVDYTYQGRSLQSRTGGATATAKAQAATLVQTAVHALHNIALLNFYQQNRTVIKAVSAVVTLDARTSTTCQPRGGWTWLLDGGAPLLHNGKLAAIPFPGPPPWHWLCRTFLRPVTYTWEQLKLAGYPGIDKVPEERRSLFGR